MPHEKNARTAGEVESVCNPRVEPMPLSRCEQGTRVRVENDRVDIEGGLPVASPLPSEGRIVSGTLPAGDVATTIHLGPYDRLPEAHDALHTWLSEHRKNSAGPQWEVYWTDPGLEPDPSKWKTELMWPIASA